MTRDFKCSKFQIYLPHKKGKKKEFMIIFKDSLRFWMSKTASDRNRLDSLMGLPFWSYRVHRFPVGRGVDYYLLL